MRNPYETLGVAQDASEAEIRGRYLQLVREFPPDRAPEKFAEIRAAFDQLRNPIVQIERKLFNLLAPDSIKDLQADLLARLQNVKLPTAVVLSLAESS